MPSDYDQFLHENIFCAKNEFAHAVCEGDYGGAWASRSTPPELLGISSWRGDWFRPDVYADVYPHLTFIRGAMR